MKFLRTISSLLRNSNKAFPFLRNVNRFPVVKRDFSLSCKYFVNCGTSVLRKSAQDAADSEVDSEETNAIDEEFVDLMQGQHISVKDILFPNSRDPYIVDLNSCASLSDVFDYLEKNLKKLGHQHIAQTVLVLWDLQKMFYHINVVNNPTDLDLNKINEMSKDFINQLDKEQSFHHLLDLIKCKSAEFDVESLGCMVLYLSKMGLPLDHEVLQLLAKNLREKLKEEFSLSALSRFMVVKFGEYPLGAYFDIQEFVPQIFGKIGTCQTSEEFKLLTICLSNINPIVRNEELFKYKENLKELLRLNAIGSGEYRTLIRIIMFLNLPEWRKDNLELINKCIMLLQNNLHELNLKDLLSVYDVFYINEEPAYILNELQRSTSKHLLQLEEDSSPLMSIRLKLFISIVTFASPINRPHYNRMLTKYFKYSLSGTSLLELFKLITFTKCSNEKLCAFFWDNLLAEMTKDPKFRGNNLLRICSNYISFYKDLPQYRNFQFERKMNMWLEEELRKGVSSIFPSSFTTLAAFIIIFGRNEKILFKVVESIEENWQQLNYLEMYILSRSLYLVLDLEHFRPLYDRIRVVVSKYLNQQLNKDSALNTLIIHMKSCLYLDDENSMKVAEKFCEKCGDINIKFSSKIIKNFSFTFYATSVLLPDIMDKMCEYVVQFKDIILGYNAEKIIYLCYYLGYAPKNAEVFFRTITDIILRDQERLSGLSYLQSCLSLCYFNKLPDSFIKQIFNVLFLEKLDAELANCYYKDRYPIRVRHRMMQLNRAVCLDYPEFNVPWFHSKYMEEKKNKFRKEREDYEFTSAVKTYLSEVICDKYVLSNVITPYGYFIDFVLHLKANQEIVAADSEEVTTKLAILLLRPGSYTKVFEQLKGPYQLKMRHLEILGYKVITLSHLEWAKLLTGEDKIAYLKNQIWPKNYSYNVCELNR